MRFGLISVLVVALMLLQACQSPAQRAAKRCVDKTMAFVMSQTFVKRGLKAPATAQFPAITDVSVLQTGKCEFLVQGFVDAQNSFGALVRSNYTIQMEYFPHDNTWGGSDLVIQ